MTQTLLVLGASGDLTERLLLPGLGGLLATGRGADLSLLGSGREDWADQHWRGVVARAFEPAKAAAGAGNGALDSVLRGARYLRADVTAPADLRRLLDACQGPAVIYFALPPAITEKTCHALRETGLPAGTRLVMEKPFGTDTASAEALNALLARLVPEDQVFRVDHFLGMSTVLNIMGVRFGNSILEPVLDHRHVASVEVVFDESLGLEGRAGYYDEAGALVDMLQSHLLQVLSLVAMEPPATISALDQRDAKAQVLRATRVWRDDPVAYSRRGQYTAGTVDGRPLPSYVDEPGVAAGSRTETFAEMVLAVDTWRWSGVPFRIRSGKAIGAPRKEVVLTFAPPPRIPQGMTSYGRPNQLRMGIGFGADQMSLDLNISGPGDPFQLDEVTMRAGFGPGMLPEYGQVLDGALRGDPSLSVRGDVAVECWRIVEPVRRAFAAEAVPLLPYPAGSAGPEGWPDTGLPSR